MNLAKFLRVTMTFMLLGIGPNVFAVDTSIATLELSGNVPVVFSVTARGLPGDLDLTPGVIVNDRLIGLLHFKYNQDIDTLTITSNTTNGSPENSAAVAYDFNTAFTVSIPNTCVTATAANAVLSAANAAVDFKKAVAPLTAGVLEDCPMTASWGGTASALPLAGVYQMTISVTMVSL